MRGRRALKNASEQVGSFFTLFTLVSTRKRTTPQQRSQVAQYPYLTGKGMGATCSLSILLITASFCCKRKPMKITLPVSAFKVMEGKAKKTGKEYKFVQLDQKWMNNNPFIDQLKANGATGASRANNEEALPFEVA